MARQYPFDAASGALSIASVACLALLPLALACGSDTGGDAAEETSTSSLDSPNMGNTPARDQSRTPASAPNTPAGAGDTPRPVMQSPAPATPPEGAGGGAAAAGDVSSAPVARAAFEACTLSEGSYGRNCDSIYVTMKEMSPPRCVQLTLDNCGDYGRQGLGVNVPMPWRLDSGSVGSNLAQCELGVFYPSSSVAVRASGSVTWNAAGRLPTEIVLDVTLTMSSTPGAMGVDVATAEPIIPGVCEG